ncbi:unnamed protein product [Rotaria sordida]|uniref:Ig-like domain-containing protein n=1 Tax=Rotaria sordida TaxID=392033 RepID=A0A814C6E6_9BILA|nr:unnamed protein product [Rotaria sordida]CAF1359684.1 unnamed protein product [Rotaria sordida]
MNFQKERTNLVVKAVEIFDNAKYSETTQAPEAAVPVEEVAPNEVEKKTEEVEPKKKEETQKKTARSKLKFLKYIASQNLMECDSLTLDCRDDDDLELIWLRNNKEIPKNPDFRHEREGNTFKLIVTAVFPDDSGIFSALLKSKSTNNEQLSSCSVIIQARDKESLDPSFVQFPQSISLEKDGKAKFNCKISGSTPMTAQWNFNEFSLEIPAVLATDQGQYSVIISNDKGQITAAYSLHVDQS